MGRRKKIGDACKRALNIMTQEHYSQEAEKFCIMSGDWKKYSKLVGGGGGLQSDRIISRESECCLVKRRSSHIHTEFGYSQTASLWEIIR